MINISFGLKEDSEELRQAVEYAEEMDVVIVAGWVSELLYMNPDWNPDQVREALLAY